LLALVQQNDEAAFAALYYRHARDLLNNAYKRLHSEQAAADVVQEVFVQFYLKCKDLPTTTDVRAYLYTSVRNRVLNELRNEELHRKHHLKLAAGQSNESYTDSTAYKQLEAKVQLHISKLPDKCREVFVLSRYEQLSHKEIAEKMGISINTVENHIAKALKILRRDLKPDELMLAVVVMMGAGLLA
jgi:RNA polymerase sigma-70 factor, ECF subfamily